MIPEKKYFNGKIGVVVKLEDEVVHVQCKDEPYAIEVKREIWENIRYTLNPSTQQVEEDVMGTFSQFPLGLHGRLPIHKSQGLTFEKGCNRRRRCICEWAGVCCTKSVAQH
jgi:hypothetical protein